MAEKYADTGSSDMSRAKYSIKERYYLWRLKGLRREESASRQEGDATAKRGTEFASGKDRLASIKQMVRETKEARRDAGLRAWLAEKPERRDYEYSRYLGPAMVAGVVSGFVLGAEIGKAGGQLGITLGLMLGSFAGVLVPVSIAARYATRQVDAIRVVTVDKLLSIQRRRSDGTSPYDVEEK